MKLHLIRALIFGLFLGSVILHIGDITVEAQQFIRLPFAPRYSYNQNTDTFSQVKYSVTNACENTGFHVSGARYAIDFGGMPLGTPIYAPISGNITYSKYGNNADNTSGYGLLIKLKEDGTNNEHWLAHLSYFFVRSDHVDNHVDKGDLIALSGETGNGPAHLHYHVQTSSGTAVDVRGQLPDIVWVDEQDYCVGSTGIDGSAHPSQIPNGVTANNCEDFYNISFQGVFGFDAPNCQGNIIFGPLYEGTYDLSSMGVNDRLRSVSTHDLNFWLYGHNNSEELKHCHSVDMWNLDTDGYNGATVGIGWDPSYGLLDVGGGESVSNAWNMVTKVVVTTNPCPSNQSSRFQAFAISYGFGVGGGGLVPTDPWLFEFSKFNSSVFNVQIHTKVDTANGYNAHRVLVDGQSIGETTLFEQYINWNTFGWADGNHTIRVEYRRTSDNGSWTNALSFEETFYLSPNRNGTRPCDGGDGVQLVSGSDCIIVTQDLPSLDHIGWNDRPNLSVTVRGNFEAWLYVN